MNTKLTGVGVGPGAPDLLTLRAAALIQNAPLLAYPVDENGFSRARETAAACIRAGQAELPLLFSMSPDREERLKTRQTALAQVLDKLQNGSDVVFITEGDPLLYSTFQHLLNLLPPDITVEICPGLSAMSAAAASARFPLAIEGSALLVLPAASALGSIAFYLQNGQSLVLFKAAHFLAGIAAEILHCGLPCEAALVENASCAGERILRDPQSWASERPSYFCLVLIRAV
ncbi:MAG: precorrin-2 C(20)-methyltransferase [Anaerolineae bacterium]|nr:precorrin-2 C(20)-methyltransferase [Anaerolineae bacterium]